MINFKTDGTFIIAPFPFFRLYVIPLPTEYHTVQINQRLIQAQVRCRPWRPYL